MLKIKIETNRKNIKKFLSLGLVLFLLSLNVLWGQEDKKNKTDLPKFHAIYVSGVAKVFFTTGESKEIEMSVSGDPYPKVIREVSDGILEIYTEGEARNEVVEVFVSNPTLKSIVVADRAEFYSTEKIKEELLEIVVDDFGMAKLDIDVKKVLIHMKGGDLKVSGRANEKQIMKSKDSDRGTLDDTNLKIIN